MTNEERTYKYGMKNRPLGIGCQPKGHSAYFEMNRNESRYHGIVFYDRELTKEEMSSFELVDLNNSDYFHSQVIPEIMKDKVIVELGVIKEKLPESYNCYRFTANKSTLLSKYNILVGIEVSNDIQIEVYSTGVYDEDCIEIINYPITKNLKTDMENILSHIVFWLKD